MAGAIAQAFVLFSLACLLALALGLLIGVPLTLHATRSASTPNAAPMRSGERE